MLAQRPFVLTQDMIQTTAANKSTVIYVKWTQNKLLLSVHVYLCRWHPVIYTGLVFELDQQNIYSWQQDGSALTRPQSKPIATDTASECCMCMTLTNHIFYMCRAIQPHFKNINKSTPIAHCHCKLKPVFTTSTINSIFFFIKSSNSWLHFQLIF